jgi:PKD repeat protein
MNKTIQALSLLLVASVVITSCRKDPEPEPTAAVIASFQYEVSETNWAEVTFTNYSVNATSHAWDFGDGNTSTETNPTHTFAEGGEYEVTLTATGLDGSASKTETIAIVDPNNAAIFLSGAGGKTWYLDREEVALGIGPAINDNSWWSFGGVTPLGERPCILDDSYTFNPDGTWEKNTNGTLFMDSDGNGGWLGIDETCLDESEPGLWTGPNGEDLSAFADGGNYTYDFNVNTNTVTIDGFGAYIGLCVKTENGDSYIPAASKMYTIIDMVEGDTEDRLSLALVRGDGSAWNFYLVHYHDEADLPPIPASSPVANFSYAIDGNTVTFTNSTSNATSYVWEFGDGAVSSQEDPVHTYAMDGNYEVSLTAYDDAGESDNATQTVTISSASFMASTLSSATGKTWMLDGEASYYVGPCQGCNDWWGGIDANGVIERACQLDDQWVFYDDGTMEYITDGVIWAEDYLGFNNECIDETELVAPMDVYAASTHTFSATDAEITVDGVGAFIGFNKAYNGGEHPGDGSGTPASSITYEVFQYTNVDGVERLTISVDYGANPGEAYWHMRLIAQ